MSLSRPGPAGLLLAVALAGCGGDLPPRLTGLYPAADAQGVPLDAALEASFDQPVLLAEGPTALTLEFEGQPVPGELELGAGGGPVRFRPRHFLLAGRTYQARLVAGGVRTLSGAPSREERAWSFRVLPGCELSASPAARLPAGPAPDGSVVIPGGRRITPPGPQVRLGVFPTHLAVWPDRELVVTTDNGRGLPPREAQTLSLVDPRGPELIQQIRREAPAAFYYGLAVSRDGARLYASGGGSNSVEVYGLAPDGRGLEALFSYPVAGYPAGLELDEARGVLYAAAQLSGELVALDVSFDPRLEPERPVQLYRRRVGVFPYDLELGPGGQKLYVSLWARDKLFEPGLLAVVDPRDGQVLTRIEVGKNPGELALAADGRLFVTCSDADAVDVIDTARDQRVASWSLRRAPDEPAGLSPTALALDEARGRLYVTCSQKNSVDALGLADGAHLGSVPAGWYPTGVALSRDGSHLFILNGKGEGTGPNLGGEDIEQKMIGTLSLTPVPDEAGLREGAARVHRNNTAPLGFFPDRCLGRAHPLPRTPGEPSPIKHVIFVLRENKTYDQNLGDLEGTHGDPSLVMFGEEHTPNLHALARRFCNLDNFHADIEVSVQGHYWNAAGTINDYAERVWHAAYRDASRLPATGAQQVDYPQTGFIWHWLEAGGVDFRNYGEPMGVAGEYTRFQDRVNIDYMLDLGLNLYSTPDAQRVRWFWDEVEAGVFPPFVFLALLNDHTYGRRPGQPTPGWMVAENDYATGLLVELVSHSPHWADTLIIVTEDDPQSGADHVDNHRSIALLISPYTQRGLTSSVHHDFSSLIRTYGLILGLPPLNMLDASAAPVHECFTSAPDFRPFRALAQRIPFAVNTYAMPGAWESTRMDFSAPDRARGLGQVLWWATRPGEPLPPQLAEELRLGPEGLDEDDEDEELRMILPVPLDRRWR
jgi:DNA-binding beta-propeller fold protein YncE